MRTTESSDPLALARASVGALAANAEDADRDAAFPVASLQVLRKNGLLGLLVPVKYGGLGGDLDTLAAVAQVLAAGCMSTAMVWAMHCQQVQVLVDHASAELAEGVLPRIAAGHIYMGSVTTGPSGGGTLMSSSSPLRLEDGRLQISRQAPIVTGAMHSDGFLITMRSSEDAPDQSVSLVYADRSQLAVEPTTNWDTLGMRGTESLGVLISGEVPASQTVGAPGDFRMIAIESMAPTGHIAWTSCWLGGARAAMTDFAELLRSPERPKGVDISSDLVRERLARIRIDLELVGAYLHRVIEEVLEVQRRGGSLDSPPVQIHLNTLKIAASELTYRSVDNLLQLAGLSLGYRKDSALALERRLRDLRSASLNYSNDRLLISTGALCLLDRNVTVI
ncbi:acyl-CoA dehydrogenase family protein [Promicromonospora sp. NPDC057488]|uniref:acyl-CoA dehydrogenase family protein n=1 Tax=Promicromonospora sp. NPDC057488 TaxID=3346147 RepID=UPI003671A050